MNQATGQKPATEGPATGRTEAMSEALALAAIFLLLARALERSWLGALQSESAGWNFLAYLLMGALAVLAVVVGRGGLAELGLDLAQMHDPAVRRTINLAVIELLAIWAMAVLAPGLVAGRRPGIILPPTFFVHGGSWLAPVSNLIGYLLTILFSTVAVGGMSELFYRGVIQARLNRVFGRPYRLFNTDFGPGLIVTTLLYTVGQGLSIYNVQSSEPLPFSPEPFLIVFSLIEGAILGFVYERTRGLLAPAILHAAIGFFFLAIELQ
jgi:membrane protease YdiL (CAAX protease family)